MFPKKRSVPGGGGRMEMEGKLALIVNKIEKKKGEGVVGGGGGTTVSNKGGGGGGIGGGVVGASKMRDCRFCGRPFILDRVQVHEAICQQSAKAKKSIKPFVDPATKAEGKKGQQEPLPSAPKWREQHEALISSIREAKDLNRRAAEGEKNLSKLPAPPPPSATLNSDTVQCPYCGRRFNKEAGARHIPQCKDYDYNKPKKN